MPNPYPKNKRNRIDAETIIGLLTETHYTPMTAAQIADRFQLKGGAIQSLRRRLRTMTLNGELALIRGDHYTLGTPADLVTGSLTLTRSKMGFLKLPDSDERIRVFPENQSTALPGDTVTVRLDPASPADRGAVSRERTGKVIRILERAQRWIVGTLRSTGRFWYVVPIDPVYDKDFYISDPGNASAGDRVVISFISWENRHVNPEGEIIEVIGPAELPSTDTLAIIRHYNLRDAFPDEVLREAELAADRLNEPGRRRDIRNVFVFTVDPETAKDFDDALSLELDAQGRRVLGVHIADVSHFVRPGGALDREAYQRGNSVYLPDQVLPMLPEQLSNGLCSLKPNEDRLAFSAWITVDDHGMPLHQTFSRSLIHSRARLTYEQAMAIIASRANRETSPLTQSQRQTVQAVHELAQQFRRHRFAANALNLDVPEWEVRIGSGGIITEIRPRVNDVSHQMVEECMIAANEAVDTELSRRGLPLIHRIHEPPNDLRLEELAANLKDMGLQPGDLRQRQALIQFLRGVDDHPLKQHVHIEVLKSMQRAEYSTENAGHYGLAKKHYSHFTSPIRRYPDLIVHRILASALGSRSATVKRADLAIRASHCSATERNAEEAERALIEIKKFRYLEQALVTDPPPTFAATVVAVLNFGLFVELDPLHIQGLIHISELSREFVRYDAARQSLHAPDHVYRIGLPLTVQVARVDFDKRQVDFTLAGQLPVPSTRPRERRGTSRRRPRRR